MTFDEAIKILDPETSRETLEKMMGGCWDQMVAMALMREAQQMALDALKEKQTGGWISVKDRLPETNKDFLCVYKFSSTGKQFVGTLSYFATDERPHWQHEGFRGLAVTHWQPLPEPPKED